MFFRVSYCFHLFLIFCTSDFDTKEAMATACTFLLLAAWRRVAGLEAERGDADHSLRLRVVTGAQHHPPRSFK